MRYAALSWLMLATATYCQAWEIPAEAVLLDDQIVCDKTQPIVCAISPDGQQIAYENRGAIWICDVRSGPPRRIADVPHTISHILAFDDLGAGDHLASIRSAIGYDAYQEIRRKTVEVHSLTWTRSQDGVTFALRNQLPGEDLLHCTTVLFADVAGNSSKLAVIERGSGEYPQRPTFIHVTADKKFVIIAGSSDLLMNCPLIWDVATNRPRMTPFDYLLPSSTSNQFLGVEIDTRQLVLVDENFEVIKRFEVILDPRRQCDLFWSPDERYAIYRVSLPYPQSRQYEVTWIDLETGETAKLADGFMTDKFHFVGNRGGFIRIKNKAVRGYMADGSKGMCADLWMPDAPARRIWEFTSPERRPVRLPDRQRLPEIQFDEQNRLFAVPWPRQDHEEEGFQYRLIDWDGNYWRFLAADNSTYISPYRALGFVNNGNDLLGYREGKLFAVPVASIKVGEGHQ